MSMEKIVRPFQTREVTPPRVVPASSTTSGASTSDNLVHVKIGNSWGVKSVNGSETIDVTYYMEKWMKEKKKATA